MSDAIRPDGTSHKEWIDESRGAGWALAAAAEEGTDTHRHRLHAAIAKAFTVEGKSLLYEALIDAGGVLADWIDDLEAQLGVAGKANVEAEPAAPPHAEEHCGQPDCPRCKSLDETFLNSLNDPPL